VPELFIDGTWRSATAGGQREIRCPATGELVHAVDEATELDTVAAIEAARTAFERSGWPDTSVHERSALLHRVADLLIANKDEIARAE
jgi:betaine-aldehyde dehydrogenase